LTRLFLHSVALWIGSGTHASGSCRRRILRPFRAIVALEQWFGSKKVVGLLGWISSRNGGAPGAVPGLLVRAGGLGGRGLPGVRGLRRAPLTRRLLPRRPVPPRPTRLRGNQLLSCILEVLGSEIPVQVAPSTVSDCLLRMNGILLG